MTRNPPIPAETLDALLSKHFGFPGFHPGQRDPIDAVLAGDDTVVVMPTGAGKSLCFQLPALALEGVTLVVSPLISLMKDQVDGMRERGLPATCLNSSISMEETADRIAALRRGETKLVYVAPERFRNTRFQELLQSLRISLIAVDEAHCISQWGHDFRPDYIRLGAAVAALPKTPIMALTATATPEVRNDIAKQLGLGTNGRKPPRVFVRGFRRDNLRLVVEPCPSHNAKLARIRKVLAEFPTGIIYCSTRKQVERVGTLLAGARLKHMVYHAGLPDEARSRAQDKFMNGEVPLVVATNAFGMGVDRADLRCVIHWDIPGSLEAYYQEVGRAGRDGHLSHCELLYNYADIGTQRFFLDGSNPDPSLVTKLWLEVKAILAKGPQTRPLDEWSEHVLATDNKITVHTCMGLFERAGLIERTIEAGNRCYTTRLSESGDIGKLKALLPSIEEKRLRDLRKLDLMLNYAHAHKCRHQFILDYFGEVAVKTPTACGRCDYCGIDTAPPPRPPTEDEWPVVQKLLSTVGRIDGRFGKPIVLAVAGAVPSKTVTEHRLSGLPVYGVLKGEPESYLGGVFDELAKAGAIVLGPAPAHAASLTALGKETAWRRNTPLLRWPLRPVYESPHGATEPHRWQAGKKAGKAATGKRSAAPVAEKLVLSAIEERVFEALKDWRRDEAAQNGTPAFVIFSNRTLKAIAIARPDSLSKLERLPGVGPAKLEAYGDAILDVLDDCR